MANDYTARTVPIPQPGEAAAAYEKRLAGFLRQEFQNVERAIDTAGAPEAAPTPIVVTGSTESNEAVIALLAALDEAGLIDDQTTSARSYMDGTYYEVMSSAAERTEGDTGRAACPTR